jgi:DNA repair protein RecN (Recombination protein N)
LRIKNLALVADLTLELQPGCNVITGETGAGKSIIIGALNLVLGERADRTLIRSGSDSCSVEAVLDVSALGSARGDFGVRGQAKRDPALGQAEPGGKSKAPSPLRSAGAVQNSARAKLDSFLEENGLEPCEENQLVLKRVFTSAGANRQFVNGSPTTLAALGTIGEWLVDMHGPHEHQSLLHASKQLAILDAFGGLQSEREAFGELVRRRSVVETEKAALIVDEKTYAQQLDLLRFQVNEISAARLQAGEDERIEEEHQRTSNAAKLLQLSQAALDLLAENENSLLTQAGIVGRTLHELQRIDPGASEILSQQEQAVSTLRDLQAGLSHYIDKVDVNPERLQELEERLNLLHTLKRKYGPTLAEVITFGDEAKQKLQSLEQRDEELARLNAALAKIDADLLRVGKDLSAKRKKIIPQLSKAVSKQLGDLGFKQSKFDVSLTTLSNEEFTQHATRNTSGLDTIEFQFAPNPGEPAKPLRAIASSGELARVMLALKTVLAAEDEIPVLVFDEVDANVGGETANVVGEKMRQIADKRQVLCITHLPQVAAAGSAHYVVSKQVKDGRTTSEISLLSKKERVTELTRMLGGQTDAARKHAEALLRN